MVVQLPLRSSGVLYARSSVRLLNTSRLVHVDRSFHSSAIRQQQQQQQKQKPLLGIYYTLFIQQVYNKIKMIYL
jgi:hypothetical protein